MSGRWLINPDNDVTERDLVTDLSLSLFRPFAKFQIATVTKQGVQIGEPKSVDTDWSFAEGLRGYGPQTQ